MPPSDKRVRVGTGWNVASTGPNEDVWVAVEIVGGSAHRASACSDDMKGIVSSNDFTQLLRKKE